MRVAERAVRPRPAALASLVGLVLLTVNCREPPSKTHRVAASASSAAPSVPSASTPAPDQVVGKGRTPMPRDTLKAPPLVPPASATQGVGGVHWQILRSGLGDSPGPVDTIVVDFSMWTADGQLAFSSYPEAEPVAFSVSTLAPSLRGLLMQLKVGSHAQFWVPRAALAGWKPPPWPDADLVFDLELLRVSHVSVRDPNGNAVEPVPSLAPDAAGPPDSAERTRNGLRYVYLAHATINKPATNQDRLSLVASAYVVEGIEVKLLRSGFKTATTLARAPGRLGELLSQLSSGDRVRVWLPAGEGKAIISEAGSREMILDLNVSF